MQGLIALFSILSFLMIAQTASLFHQEQLSADSTLIESFLAAEKASFQRKIIEENTRFLIEKELKRELQKENIEPLLIKTSISSKLDSYFNRLQLGEKPSFQEMTSSFKVLVIVVDKKLITAKFYNTGNPMSASFEINALNQTVLIPKNYLVEVIQIA